MRVERLVDGVGETRDALLDLLCRQPGIAEYESAPRQPRGPCLVDVA